MSGPTMEQVSKWTMREEMHHNGGGEWFGYTHRCVEEPRLTRFDRYEKKTRSVTSTWRVDWIDHASLEDAVEALAVPRAECEHHWTKSLPRATSTTDVCILCRDTRPTEIEWPRKQDSMTPSAREDYESGNGDVGGVKGPP